MSAAKTAPLEVNLGDTVTVGNNRKQWTVTDVYERGPMRQLQASIRDGLGTWRTHVPLHELLVVEAAK